MSANIDANTLLARLGNDGLLDDEVVKIDDSIEIENRKLSVENYKLRRELEELGTRIRDLVKENRALHLAVKEQADFIKGYGA